MSINVEKPSPVLGGEKFKLPVPEEEPVHLPMPGPAPTPQSSAAVPEELREAWSNYMRRSFENNETMFKRTLEAFMTPYNITIAMYVAIFIVGLSLFGFAAYLGLRGDQPLTALGFAGLGVVSLLTFFIRQPLQALEENLEFITWQCVVFNTYWTRLMYLSNNDTIQEDLKNAQNDFSNMIEYIIDKHASMNNKRAGSNLGDNNQPTPQKPQPTVTP
jgi:hypothetical protein